MLKAENVDHTHAAGSNHVSQRDMDVLWNLPQAGRAAHLPEDFSNLPQASGA
jgi:hypothetical protein